MIRIKILCKKLGTVIGKVDTDFKLRNLVGVIEDNALIEIWHENSLRKKNQNEIDNITVTRRKLLFKDGNFIMLAN